MTVFGESFTLRLAAGILLILSAVILIIAGRSLSLPKIRSALIHAKGKRFRR